MVKKVVRRAEVKGHRHGFRVSGVLLIEAADNPRPVHKLCHQTQHPKQDHHLESPRARPESLPALSFDSSQQVVQKQEEKQQRRYESKDRKSTRLNSSHVEISYAVFCLKKKKNNKKK